jgi:hypothetical protein
MGRWIALAVLLAVAVPAVVWACPFCSAVSVTLGEELKGADAAVIAKFVAPAAGSENTAESLGSANVMPSKFQVIDVLKGADFVKPEQEIEVVFFGNANPGDTFLIMGIESPKTVWSTPVPLSARAVQYVKQIPTLPENGPERLAYFLPHLEDSEEMLSRDAYDEIAKAPYAEIKGLKDRLNRQDLLARISDRNVPASRRRMYLTMLGVCGQPEDVASLEELIRSSDREMKTALDAMIACYLTLKGPEGMPLIEELFLGNPKAEYTDTYSAIMALRFHGQEEQAVPKDRLLAGFRLMLDRPELADLVIPDLARWEDWSAMPRLVELFKNATEESNWVRVPVINYLRACPLPEAKAQIDELAQIDPDAVKRANSFFPFAAGAPPVPPPPTPVPADQEPLPAETTNVVSSETPETPAEPKATDPPATEPKQEEPNPADAATVSDTDGPIPPDPKAEKQPAAQVLPARDAVDPALEPETPVEPVVKAQEPDEPQIAAAASPAAPAAGAPPEAAPPHGMVALVPLTVGAGLFGLLLFILRGSSGTSAS